MSSVNTVNNKEDFTVRVFDRFYDFEFNAPAEQWDIVYSYFQSIMATEPAATNFATSLFRVSEQTGVPALTLLQALQGQSGMQLTSTLCYYLNLIRSRATLLGITAGTQPNFYAARSVLQ